MTTALFILRALQSGLKLSDLEELEFGEVVDITIEAGNDYYDYRSVASQKDYDRF